MGDYITKELLSNNLRRYMKIKEFTIPELSLKSSVSRATISNILNQKADPSISILDKLSVALETNTSALFTEKPLLPNLRFRTNKTMSPREKAQKENLLFTVAQKLEEYNAIENITNKKMQPNFPILSKNPKKVAQEIRTFVGIPYNHPIDHICSRIRILGIKQFYFSFGLNKTFGLSVNQDNKDMAIFVNTGTASVERWIFTVAHELGHLILDPNSYDGKEKELDKNSPEEKAADKFAAEFLLPQEFVENAVKGTSGFSFINKVIELKKQYRVSYTCVLKQYCEAYNRDYGEVIGKFKKMYSNYKKYTFSEHSEPEALDKGLYIFEDKHIKDCVYEALDTGKLKLEKAASILNKNLDEFKQEYKCFKDFEKLFSSGDAPF